MSPFALLDDRAATRERPTSRLYTGFLREHRCTDLATLDAAWAQVEADQRAGHVLVGVAQVGGLGACRQPAAGDQEPGPGQPAVERDQRVVQVEQGQPLRQPGIALALSSSRPCHA